MGHEFQVIVHEPEDIPPRWRNSALDEYLEKQGWGRRPERSSNTASQVFYGESLARPSYGKREPVFGSLSARNPRRTLFTPEPRQMKTVDLLT